MTVKDSASSSVATDRYQSILRAAEMLFREKGYQSVSIDEIAKTAAVSKGLVHYHFTSKEELLESILKGALAALTSRLSAIARSDKTTLAKIQESVEVYLSEAGSRLDFGRTVFSVAIFTEKTKEALLALREQILLGFARLVDHGIARGEFKPVDSRLTAIFVIGMIFEVLREAAMQGHLPSATKIAGDITRTLYEGIGQPPGEVV